VIVGAVACSTVYNVGDAIILKLLVVSGDVVTAKEEEALQNFRAHVVVHGIFIESPVCSLDIEFVFVFIIRLRASSWCDQLLLLFLEFFSSF